MELAGNLTLRSFHFNIEGCVASAFRFSIVLLLSLSEHGALFNVLTTLAILSIYMSLASCHPLASIVHSNAQQAVASDRVSDSIGHRITIRDGSLGR